MLYNPFYNPGNVQNSLLLLYTFMSFLNNKRSMSSIKQVLALLGSCSEIQVQLRNSILSSSLQLDLLRPVREKIMQILDQCPEIPNSIEDIAGR